MLQNAQILENKKIIDDVYQLTVKEIGRAHV